MSATPQQLEKVYEPQAVEARWRDFWIQEGFFEPNPDSQEPPYTIVIPPPNVTGSLHIGHALNNTLQDILVRWRRMQGRRTLWLPGTDHAGIATQNVVERQLLQEGTNKEQLGREAFIQRIWQWKQESGDRIIDQLKKLGASCDWSRLRFTMDDGLSRAVREVFVRLYEDGLLYRGERLINWCPRCLTALSDIEVEHEQTQGKMYHIRYPLHGQPNISLTIATTRPETLLGDTAVAVHPEDERYRHLIGQQIDLPLTARMIPIVGDPLLVDKEFGTGAVKITPAHDFNDFEAGERHRLPRLSIFDPQARLDAKRLQAAQVEPSLCEALQGKSVAQARNIVIDVLKERGTLLKIEDHTLAIGKCYRCKTTIEPFLSPQWFVNIQPLADPAIDAVESGAIRIIPETWTNNYLGWMRGIKDWCISRQIWWGHRIPAWYCLSCRPDIDGTSKAAPGHQPGESDMSSLSSGLIPSQVIPLVARTQPQQCPTCGSTSLIQDPDVLDTWFSSALWPFSTLGWPEITPDFKQYYPTSTLVTGLDILFFWVARMIMMGLKFTGQVPFHDVYIHALVRDAEGQKMSKSKGNVIDPLTKMSEYGTDALRFTLASMASPGRDIKLAEERIEGYRNFANKIWNAARFIQMNASGLSQEASLRDRSLPDRWMLSRLNELIQDVNQSLEDYRFDHAAAHLYQFTWHEYCDWYLELIKPALQSGETTEAQSTRHTLLQSFDILLRLLHPFMPFVTEEIWQTLPHDGRSIMVQPFPKPETTWHAPDAEAMFALVERFVTTARTGRSLLDYGPSKPLVLYGTDQSASNIAALSRCRVYLEHLVKGTVQITEADNWNVRRILRLIVGGTTIGMEVEGGVDLKKALTRVTKQILAKTSEASRLEGRLASPDFTAKASAEVIQESTNRLNLLTQELALLKSSESQLTAMIE